MREQWLVALAVAHLTKKGLQNSQNESSALLRCVCGRGSQHVVRLAALELAAVPLLHIRDLRCTAAGTRMPDEW